jgi:2-C-methyl-D-erythritol 4-phosphate cytidylyltransferase
MNSAVIVAAGRGTRMGPGIDKLFLEVAGRPVVAHTWRRMDRSTSINEIVLVVRSGLEAAFVELASRHVCPTKSWRMVVGGAERQDSVWNGVSATDPQAELVIVQDGARPCTHAEHIRDCIEAARNHGASVGGFRVTDTIKESDGNGRISRHLDRSRLWAVQTPQCFRRHLLINALSEVKRLGIQVTDDTAACELIGQSVVLVEGRWPNPKVTTREDLPYVELLLQQEARA